eukprot:6060156-Karenia_brevis.AAC.1
MQQGMATPAPAETFRGSGCSCGSCVRTASDNANVQPCLRLELTTDWAASPINFHSWPATTVCLSRCAPR